MFSKSILMAAVAAAALSSIPAAAADLIVNGNFEQTSLTRSQQFTGTEVTGWTNQARPSQYTEMGYNFLIRPNTADSTGFYSVYGNHDYVYGPNGTTNYNAGYGTNFSNNGFTGVSPTGGNFLLMDGDTNFQGTVSQVITGLTAGQQYTLKFDWAGLAWYTTPGKTTHQFDVTFGSQTQSSNLLTADPKGFTGWKNQTMTFTATATSQTLSFLAKGTPNGLPPTMLLDNVSLNAVPEPATWGLMILGFGAVGGSLRRTRARAKLSFA